MHASLTLNYRNRKLEKDVSKCLFNMKNCYLFFTLIICADKKEKKKKIVIIIICIMNRQKAYVVLITLELTCVGTKYGVSNNNNNPFQRLSPTILVFFLAMFSHVLALTANMNFRSTIITFHVSGVVACDTLFWILRTEFFHYYVIINLLLSLLAFFYFFNHIANITRFLCAKVSNAVQMPDMESHESQV